jgi:hypothetical protein
MVDTLSTELQLIGGAIPFRHGVEFINSTIFSPIPRAIWPGKPEGIRDILIQYQYGSCARQCPTFSLVGDLYADFGLWSVAAGAAIFGFVLNLMLCTLRRWPESPLIQVAYCAVLWTAFHAWRSGFSIVFEYFVFLTGPCLLLAVLGRRAQVPEDPVGVPKRRAIGVSR